MVIAVGSKNPAKIKAAKSSVKELFPEAKIILVDAPSGVSSQPKSDGKYIKGALNRAKFALGKVKGANFAIGMEGGMHKIGKHWFACCWIAVVDKNGNVGIGSSGKFQVPLSWAKKAIRGKELGDVIDETIGLKNIRAKGGAMGVLQMAVSQGARLMPTG